MEVAYLKSITTGNEVPCVVKKRSVWRRLFLLPSVQVVYVYQGLFGTEARRGWRYPSEVHED